MTFLSSVEFSLILEDNFLSGCFSLRKFCILHIGEKKAYFDSSLKQRKTDMDPLFLMDIVSALLI